MKSRRKFIVQATLGTAAVSLGMPAYSYNRILGANDRINLAVAGLNSRGRGHVYAASNLKDHLHVMGLCDVDNRVFARVVEEFPDYIRPDVKTYADVRKLLENKDLDALTIATPDHWHAPMAIMAMQAGKHVYLEKPCSHNPQEGEWLIAAEQSTGKVLQIGNQQRSAPTSINVIQDIRDGIIGNPYYGKAWYANTRGSIGNGKSAPVPDWLNWELWQGPAPRKEFKDNWVHYNWHWFWHWGTGEINNNGLHELDICRWALDVDLPVEVNSSGGRYHYDDDWEFYDTQIANFRFDGDKMISWEGRSCNGSPLYNRGRGAAIYGTEGTVIVDRNGYEIYDRDNNLIKQELERSDSASLDTQGIGSLDTIHMMNFADGIRKGSKLNSPMAEAHKSTLLCHLGNMAQRYNRTLKVNPQSGQPDDGEAMKLWSRTYEKGWKPAI